MSDLSGGLMVPRMIGESAAFLEMQEHVSLVAKMNRPVLVVGERGTGKELVAARLHYLSERWQQAFLQVNCATLSDSLLDAQLFGHEAGAFTGATSRRKGLFERVHGGTLFLDEITATSMAVQEKMLRVIEYGQFERLGGSEVISVDVRVVAAANEDLPTLAREGRFREDLLDRLAFDVVTLPPLRARKDDILVLAEHFAIWMTKELGLDYFAGFSESAQQQLLSHAWPGNVRELRNVVERAVYQQQGRPVTQLVLDPFESPYRPGREMTPRSDEEPRRDDSRREIRRPEGDVARGEQAVDAWRGQPMDFRQHIRDYEIAILRQALAHCQFNQRKTAEFLNVSYHQLRGYLRKYELLS